jgi:hypothetical protein
MVHVSCTSGVLVAASRVGVLATTIELVATRSSGVLAVEICSVVVVVAGTVTSDAVEVDALAAVEEAALPLVVERSAVVAATVVVASLAAVLVVDATVGCNDCRGAQNCNNDNSYYRPLPVSDTEGDTVSPCVFPCVSASGACGRFAQIAPAAARARLDGGGRVRSGILGLGRNGVEQLACEHEVVGLHAARQLTVVADAVEEAVTFKVKDYRIDGPDATRR